MLVILGIILLCCPQEITSNILLREIHNYHNETYYKAEHAFQVVNKIYDSLRTWFFTVTFCEFTYFENRILKYTETMDYGYPVLLLDGCPNDNKTKSKPKINIHGNTAYVITSDVLNIDVGEYITDALLRTGVFKPRSTVIFILNTPVTINDYFFYSMKNHFQFLWSKGITNSIVMLLWSNKLWTYTYNFFLNEIEDITDVKDIHSWLFHQYDDLYGHELRLSVFNKIYLQDNLPLNCESSLAFTVMKELNATCKPLAPRDGTTVGDLLPNGTATGVTADLINGYTDIELKSRILKNSYYGIIDTTYPFTQDELCFMIKNDEEQSTFATIISLISVKILLVFIFIVTTLIVIAIVARELEMRIWNIREMRTISTAVVDLVKCFIRQTVDIKLPGFVYRCTVLMIMIYSLVVDCIIDGVITSAVTYPRFSGNVNTMDELIQSNLTLGVHNRHIRTFNKCLDDHTYTIIKDRIEILNDKKILEIITERQFQYAVLLKKAEIFYITGNITNIVNDRPVFRLLSDCPLPISIVYGLRYGSPYLNKINNILHHLNQGGILSYWAKTEQTKINQKHFNPDNNKEIKPLTLGNLQELFVVWAFGLGLSTIVFLMELVVHYKKRQILRRLRVQKLTSD